MDPLDWDWDWMLKELLPGRVLPYGSDTDTISLLSYERRLDPEARNSPQDLARLPFALSNAADGSTRIVRLNQVAQVVDAYNAAKVKEGVVPKPLPAK